MEDEFDFDDEEEFVEEYSPAITFPFPLDPFQEEAISHIDNSNSVLVSAHTSAGKTVVAKYAIAKALKNNERVIYTAPIKALSNQKYREFSESFGSDYVGLMTGDCKINSEGSCLIMTTEILRSLLFKKHDPDTVKIMQSVSYIIFDEIHYMSDRERGFVWEEAIILLARYQVHFVFLSATMPNARQFAEWVAFLNNQPCYVVHTDYRPVPLKHYIYPGGKGVYLILDGKGNLREENLTVTIEKVQQYGHISSLSKCIKVVKFITENDLAPAIVFSFQKKDCEFFAQNMAVRDLENLDFTSVEEKEAILNVFKSTTEALSKDEQELAQVRSMLHLLERGIGIHHGGLMPIVKEMIEIMFSKCLIKILFATDSFGIGLNMPAKTVVFTDTTKFDGVEKRLITSGEYSQMAGRAGRRGLDKTGAAILILDNQVKEKEKVLSLLERQTKDLNSAFRPTYGMILNLLSFRDFHPEDMLRRSFLQLQKYGKSHLPSENQGDSIEIAELKKRKSLLCRLGFCSTDDILTQKGRFACLISSGDELLITEMVFERRFDELDATQTAALLSCFVCDEKSSEPQLSEPLLSARTWMKDQAQQIAKASEESFLELDSEKYVEQFKSSLMTVVMAWCGGSSFEAVCKMTHIYEGSIIRIMRRLEELLREMAKAAKATYMLDLEKKLTESINLIKRGVISSNSLYVDETECER